jgi:hypothetical protein
MPYAALLLLTTTRMAPLTRAQAREDRRGSAVDIGQWRATVRAGYYDPEAYSARPSDVLGSFETSKSDASLIDAICASSMFAEPYFLLDQLLVGERARSLDPGSEELA